MEGITASLIRSAVICWRLHCDKGNLCQHSARILEKSDSSFPSSPFQRATEAGSSKIATNDGIQHSPRGQLSGVQRGPDANTIQPTFMCHNTGRGPLKKLDSISISIIDACAGETKVQGTVQSQVLHQQFFFSFSNTHSWSCIMNLIQSGGLMECTIGDVSSKQCTACSLLLQRAVQFFIILL